VDLLLRRAQLLGDLGGLGLPTGARLDQLVEVALQKAPGLLERGVGLGVGRLFGESGNGEAAESDGDQDASHDCVTPEFGVFQRFTA
jgi:hypothetical protein